MTNTLDVEKLRAYFAVQGDGALVRIKTAHHHYAPAGQVVRGIKGKGGYLVMKFKGRSCMYHRVVWALTHGLPVPGRIYFNDGNPTNTKIENLRGTPWPRKN